jgi:hypothetical protein
VSGDGAVAPVTPWFAATWLVVDMASKLAASAAGVLTV